MRILVTGGAGFVGSHLARALLARGHDVVVLDNFLTGKRENLAPILDRIRLVEGDLRVPADVADALEGVEAVLHQAALPSVPKSLALPVESHHCNIVGTLNLLHGAHAAGVKRVVYAASSSAYGDQPVSPKVETMTPKPLSPYAVQKLTGEYYCKVFHRIYGLETVGLRYFNVFGPWQDPKSKYAAVVPAFVTRMLRGESPIVHGDGLQSRDFTYIDNVIEANVAALEAPASSCGRTYNVALGESCTLLDMIDAINETLGTRIEPVHIEPRAGDVRHSKADVGSALERLGWKARVSVAEGMALTIAWYQQNAVEDQA